MNIYVTDLVGSSDDAQPSTSTADNALNQSANKLLNADESIFGLLDYEMVLEKALDGSDSDEVPDIGNVIIKTYEKCLDLQRFNNYFSKGAFRISIGYCHLKLR